MSPAEEGLKVLILAPIRFPLREPFAGGLEAQTCALASGLTARGHTVQVAGATGSDPLWVSHEIGRLPDPGRERADTAEAPPFLAVERALYADLFRDVAQGLLGSFDLVLNNSLHPLPVERAADLPIPLVTALHTPALPWAPRAVRAPVDFVAVSESTRMSWSPFVDSVVVRNGVDTRAWTAGPGGSAAVWFGRIVPEKAPHLAIDIAEAAGLPLTLAGPIIDRPYFAARIAPRLKGSIRYAGHLTRSELARLVGHSAVALVTPVWDEPFGLVAVEAMACGTPVLALARGGLTEIVDRTTGRLLAPGSDPKAATVRLGDVLHLDRAAVRASAVRHWSLDAMVAGYERVFTDVLRARDDAA